MQIENLNINKKYNSNLSDTKITLIQKTCWVAHQEK